MLIELGDDRLVAPVALYEDGAPCCHTDSIVGFRMSDLATQRRRLTAVLRKRNGRTCGRKGWCSLCAVFRVLGWSFEAMTAGASPPGRHDGLWGEAGSRRAARAGGASSFASPCCT